MGVSRKMLYFAASLTLAVAFISIVYHVFFAANGSVKNSISSVEEESGELIDPNFAAFDGSSLSGSDTLSMIGKYPQYTYQFITKMCPNGFSSDAVSNDAQSVYYVNPTNVYDVKFVRSSSNFVYKILVIQRECKVDDKVSDVETSDNFFETARQEALLFHAIKQYSTVEGTRSASDTLANTKITEQDIENLQEAVRVLESENAAKEKAVLDTESK